MIVWLLLETVDRLLSADSMNEGSSHGNGILHGVDLGGGNNVDGNQGSRRDSQVFEEEESYLNKFHGEKLM